MFLSQSDDGRVVQNRIGRAMIAAARVIVLAAVCACLVSSGAAAPKEGGGKGGGNKPVCLAFMDDELDAIQSDGGGDYCHGVDFVEALLTNKDGNLEFDSRKIRSVFLDLSDTVCIDPDSTDCPDVPPPGLYRTGMFTDRTFDLRTIPLGENGVSAATPVGLLVRFVDAVGNEWVIVFGSFSYKFPCPEGSELSVTALDVDPVDGVPDAWTIEAFPGDIGCLYRVLPIQKGTKVRENHVLVGHVSLPFFATFWLQ